MTSKKHSGSGDRGKLKDRAVPLLKPDGRFNTVHLLPVFLNMKQSSFSLAKPSIFNNEMQMSTEDRIHKLIHTREKIALKADTELEHFESFRFFPKVVVFQNFNPGKVYKVPVSVRNACQVIKPLQITYEESQHFSVTFASGLFTRIAPGMSAVLMVHFSPEDKRDYSYQIAMQSNKECFKVPIIAVGPRPLLDFPDDIHIPAGPIKIRCTKVVLVRNIGDISAIFSLSTNSPFDVEPRKGVLRPSEMMNVRLSVTPKTFGNIQGQLRICYETGEILYSQIYGVGEEANIWMDKSRITIEETFIGVKQIATVTLHNESDYLLNFKWKKMETVEEELIEYDKLMNGYSFLRNLESQKYSKLSKGDLVDPETHSQVYNRMFDDEVKALRNEEFLFNHPSFELRPLSGDIWPKSSIDIMVSFEPTKPGEHTTVAYCEIPGHDKRLPLMISGNVKGPQFAFNLDFLDIDCVFVSKPHSYELVVKNVGLVPGTIAFQPSSTQYGGIISCSPESVGLMPEECNSFLVTFSSNVQGEFLENILFEVVESGDILQIELKGSVVTPTLRFSEDSIDFGIVPFSFPISHVVLLQNLSMVQVNYKLTMIGDGVESSVSYKQFASSKEKPRFPKNPKEFWISPSLGTVDAYSCNKIKITLIGNVNREKKSTLVLEMLDAISEPVRLPISHTVAFPAIKCTPNDITIRFCFVTYPYIRTLVLENKSDVMGFFHILPQSVSGASTLMFSAPVSHGIIKAGSKIKIPITILTNCLGLQTCTISMFTLGDDAPREICTLSGCGQGPVMTAEPHLLDYGNVELLDTVTKEFILTNDSPVPANYSITLARKNSPWEVVHDSGVLPAEKNIAIEVNVFLRDTGKYKDTLRIEVFGSRTLQVTLIAEGVGTSLVIDPKFCPVYDLECVLTNKNIERLFTITNEGNRHHQITWSPLPELKDPPHKRDAPVPTVRTVFHIEPAKVQLSGRQSTQFILQGLSEKVQQVEETFYCHAVIMGKKETLLSAKIKANFIDPKVVFSKPEISFYIDIAPDEKYQILYDNVEMTNNTDLSFKIQLRTEYPFLIMGKDGPVPKLFLALNSLSTVELTIVFDTSCVTDLFSRKFRSFLQVSYKEHIHMDFLPLSGEVNFPNLNIFPDILDFGCIPCNSSASEIIEIINDGHLPITYRWHWLPDINVDYADECCRKKSPLRASNVHVDDESATSDDKSSVKGVSICKHEAEEELELKGRKLKRRKRVSKVTDEEIKAVLFPVIAQFFEEDTEEQALQSLPQKLKEMDRENQYFDLTPWYGQLQPHEVQTISAKFSGSEPTLQCGVLVCEIEGGPTQVLLVRGEISDLEFTLDKTVVDIGYQIFCMPSFQNIKLTNVGSLPFDFSIKWSSDDLDTKKMSKNLKVEPNDGFLASKQFQTFVMDITPGFIRKFNETFTIQVGYLDPVPITLEGWGVIPQLYAFLPRPKSYITVIDIGYEAIDLLLEDFLLNEKRKKKKRKKSEQYNELSLFGRNVSKRELKVLMRKGWTVITYEDQYPTIAEIDLTVEKLIAQEHIDSCSLPNFKKWSKNMGVPGLIFPPYEIDFGIVVVGTSVSYSALLYNFGPIPVSGSFQYNPMKTVLNDQGFSFKVPTISKLDTDQTVSMQIYFNPTRRAFQERLHNVDFLIFLDITFGARIPIQVRAIVTTPYLVASTQEVNFQTIKCGERKTITITLKNEGLVPCTWQADIKGKKNETCFTFGFLDIMSTLLPQQTVEISTAFKPSTPGPKENFLIITVEGTMEKLEISLSGSAVEPRVTLSDHVLQFEPTLPYPENFTKSFKVRNACNDAIEFYLPHIDSQVAEEERILRVLCDYYETDHLCLPLRKVGEELPKEITQFYQMLLVMLRSIDDDFPSNQGSRKKRKRSSKLQKPKFVGSDSQTTVMSHSQVTLTSDSPQTVDNIEESLHAHMEELRKKLKNSDKNDPVQDANNAVNKTDTSLDNEPAEGMLLIFHGAPFTDSIFYARKIAKSLNLKFLNIDDIILEAAATSSFPEAIKLRDKINSLYSEIRPITNLTLSKGDLEDLSEFEEEEEDELDDFSIDDPIEELKKKVKVIIAGPKNNVRSPSLVRGQSRKVDQTSARTSSQHTRRSSGKKGITLEGPCAIIPGIAIDSLEEIIKKRLFSPECLQGVVIDNLSSMFFESANMTFLSILRAAGYIKYIHCFFFYNTLETFTIKFKEDKEAAEEAERSENERKIALFETLTVEEVEELPEGDQELYWNLMMNKRKDEWFIRKREECNKNKKNKKRVSKVKKNNIDEKRKQSKTGPENQSPSESIKKKEKRKSEGKGKSKIDASEIEEQNVDELFTAQTLFNTFESEYNEIIAIAMNWDKKKGILSTSANNKANTKRGSTRKTPVQSPSTTNRASLFDTAAQNMKYEGASANSPTEDEPLVIWIFDCANPSSLRDELITGFMIDNEEFNSSRPEPSRNIKPVPETVNWCVSKPKIRQKIRGPEEFIFCNYEEEEEDGEKEKQSKKPKVMKRRNSKKKETDVKLDGHVDAIKLKSRWILNPGTEVEIKVQFDPHSVGEYMFTYPLEVIGWKKPQYITLQGICDLPRIDMEPEVLFDHVVENKEPDKLYRLTYYLNKNFFDFGAILVTKPKDKRLHHIATSFNMFNCSTLPAEIRFSFLDKTFDKVDAFAIEPVLLNVQPSSSEKVTVFATPRSLGTVSETIMCSIKDNPAVERIKVSCTGVKVDFEVEPKSIIFDHVLVFRKDFRIIKLKNKSLVPIIWHLIGFDDAFLEQFDISSTEGLIMPLDDQDIRVEFFATQVVSSMKKTIKVEVFDEEGRGEAIHTENIHITAESVDVVVDISFSDPRKNYIDFGKAKVRTECLQLFYLKNRGKHDVRYKIDFDIPPNVNIPSLQKIFRVRPSHGILEPGEKASPIEVSCNPFFEVVLYAVPIFKCYLLDGQNIVATIPIQASISAQWCSYEISPKPDVNFGAMPIGSRRTLPITIKNTGVWDISFSVCKMGKSMIEEMDRVASDSAAADSIKAIDKKGDKDDRPSLMKPKIKSFRDSPSASLKCELFTITPTSGHVPVGEMVTLEVECCVDNEGTYNEMISINIPDKSADNPLPEVIELSAVACAPVIDFTSVNSIFEEHYICENLEDMNCPCDMKNYNVFVKSENKFLFSNTCLGVPNEARLKLQNPGLVPCEVSAVIRSAPSSSMKTVKSSESAFSVKPPKLSIPPYTTGFLEMIFTPLQIGIYNAIIEVSLETASSHKDNKFTTQLVGEGCVPIITLIEPPQIGSPEDINLVFHPTLLGKKTIQTLVFQNTGVIPCNVKIDKSEFNRNIFIIKANVETSQLIVSELPEDPECDFLSLPPDLKATFEITFMSNEIGKFSGPVNISVFGNPYEKIAVKLFGECYTEEITFELPSTFLPEDFDSDKPCQYMLTFNHCYVDSPKHISFKIYNHSQKSVFRFEFKEEKYVYFSPSVGHIKPNCSKEITATLFAPEPVIIKKALVECQLEKITLSDGIPEGTSWDSRLTTVHWRELTEANEDEEAVSSQNSFEVLETVIHEGFKFKTIKPEHEPNHEVVPDSLFTLPLQVTATVAYTKYKCDINDYEFPETFMFHKRSYEFTFTNSGIVPLSYTWNIVMDEHYPLRVPSPTPAENTEYPTVLLSASENVGVSPSPNSPPRTSKVSKSNISAKRKKDLDIPVEDVKEPEVKNEQAGPDKESVHEDEFSMSPSVSNRSHESWLSTDQMPFTVEPSYGNLNPGETAMCKLTYSPKDIFDFKVIVIAMIPHLDPNLEPLKIIVKGRSVMPLCYFKIDETDYLTGGRRDLSLPGPCGLNPGVPLHVDTKVVEFKVVGITGTHSKKLTIINPTEASYNFYWENVTLQSADTVSMFFISPMKGRLGTDSEVETSCNFIAHDTGTFESFWNFVIPEHDVKYYFLLVSHVSEPSACFLTSHVELCPTLIGLNTVKYASLINNEEIPLKFQIDLNSLLAVGHSATLDVNPMKGKIAPAEEVSIRFQYIPKLPGMYNFHVKCHIKGMRKPLTLDVSAECYSVQPLVSYEPEKNQTLTLSPTEANVIDLGEVSIKCPQTINFSITNTGKSTFYYFWQYDENLMKKNKFKVNFQSKGGHITSQSRTICPVTFTFFGKNDINGFPITLQINKGPDYKLLIKGCSTKPNYEFSSLNCNFGTCFFKEFNSYCYKKSVYIKNNEVAPILIECLFQNTTYLQFENANGTIAPDETKEIIILFSPQGLIKYEEVIEFIINGCTKEKLKITGEGIDIQVGLQNPQHKLILFAPVLPGGSGFACAPVINNSKSEVVVEFFCGKKNWEDATNANDTELANANKKPTQQEMGTSILMNPFDISPLSEVHLKPQEVVNVCIRFRPTIRTKLFSDKVYMKIMNQVEPLCILEGSCIGPDFCFDRYYIAFGSVLKGCTTQQKLKLINSGEVGARFQWEPGEWNNPFRIIPMKGYSSPDTETTFTIVFCPNDFERIIRYMAVCTIDDFAPLRLNLTGACWEEPVPRDHIVFRVPVRSQDKKTITIVNKTVTNWELSPRLVGQYFYGPDIFNVPAHSNAQYEVTFTPLVMTVPDNPHTGSVVFCMPEGQALGYHLIGHADKPLSSGKITREIRCKENYTELIPISNWLTTSQRFTISNEVMKTEKFDPVVVLSGNEYIDVPGKSEREYRWTVFCYRECVLNIKVCFTNDESKEYLFYDLVLKVVKRSPFEVVKLTTPVRKEVTHSINLHNPLGVDVNYNMHCSSSDIHCKTPIPVQAFSKCTPAIIKYIPLFEGQSAVTLDLYCSELGNFLYEFNLTALPPIPEKLIKCSIPLGSSTTLEAPVINMTKTRAEYFCKVDHQDFETDKQVTLPANSKGNIVVTFEPTLVGNMSATLNVVSPTAGEFQFHLMGISSLPTPQGPYTIKMGSSVNIPFKNIFNDKQIFNYSVDNRQFFIKNTVENIRPKKDTKIVVGFPKNSGGNTIPATGKLVVFSTTPGLSNYKWIYYLKGVESN